MKNDSRKRRWEEWDSREKARTREWRKSFPRARNELRLTTKKFNPRNRFRLMAVCLSTFLLSAFVLWLTIFDAFATYQLVASLFSAITSGTIFLVNYGKDIVTTIVNSLTKSSLK